MVGGKPKPGQELGKYRLERLLGKGGMGEVWSAYDPDLDRRIALKVLHPHVAAVDDARARFAREGRAMARLRHPNVITVHDATFSDGRGLIAMELVDGESLATWMTRAHPVGEIVRVILAAGRGLAAAHAAGMIHRDFKPHNVLIEKDGRVLVTDFGLARSADLERTSPRERPTGNIGSDKTETPNAALDETATPNTALDKTATPNAALDETATPNALDKTATPSAALDETATPDGATKGSNAALEETATPTSTTKATTGAAPRPPTGDLATPLTEVGDLLGTPAYMAPEQLDGDPADARSDIFAFCVTAWELFTGVRPFRAKSFEDLRDAILRGPSNADRIPRRLRQLLLRGLAFEPDARWPTIDALLGAIDRAWKRPRRIAIAVAALAVVGGAAGAFYVVTREAPIAGCDDDSQSMATVWTPAVRADLDKLVPGPFKRTSLEYMDRWAKQWQQRHDETCKRPQTAERVSQRTCLETLRYEIVRAVELRDAAAGLFSAPDLPRVIPLPDACMNDPIGTAALPPPAAIKDEIASIRLELAVKRLPMLVGDFEAAAKIELAPVVARAVELGYRPTIAEAKIVHGLTSMVRPQDQGRSCDLFAEAAVEAEAVRYERMVVEALILRHDCLLYTFKQVEESRKVLARLESITARAKNPFQQALILVKVGERVGRDGLANLAVEKTERACTIFDALQAEWQGATCYIGLATSLYVRHRAGDFERADSLLAKVVAKKLPRYSADASSELLNLDWYRGKPVDVPVEPAEPKSPLKLELHVEGGIADIAAGKLLLADSTRVVMPEHPDVLAGLVDDPALVVGNTNAGVTSLVVPNESVVFARAGDTSALAASTNGTLALKLMPSATALGTSTGVHDALATDPHDFATRATTRHPGVVMLARDLGGPRFVALAPIDVATGGWRIAGVPPGRYLMAMQAETGLSGIFSAQRWVDLVAGENRIPPIELSLKPRVVEVIARPKINKVVVFSTTETTPPNEWPAMRKLLESSPSIAAARFDVPTLADRDTTSSDGIIRVPVVDGPAMACALDGPAFALQVPLAWPAPSKQKPRCALVKSSDTRVVIE